MSCCGATRLRCSGRSRSGSASTPTRSSCSTCPPGASAAALTSSSTWRALQRGWVTSTPSRCVGTTLLCPDSPGETLWARLPTLPTRRASTTSTWLPTWSSPTIRRLCSTTPCLIAPCSSTCTTSRRIATSCAVSISTSKASPPGPFSGRPTRWPTRSPTSTASGSSGRPRSHGSRRTSADTRRTTPPRTFSSRSLRASRFARQRRGSEGPRCLF